jgi:tetratricopeptide (TPR) repeat protein
MQMEWLQQSALQLVPGLPAWLVSSSAQAVAAIAGVAAIAAVGVAIAGALIRRHRQRIAARTEHVRGVAQGLKEELRMRLSEPDALFSDDLGAAPTMGASEAFESDIDAAARTVLQETGGHRAKAMELLRRRLNGPGDGKLNGSEVNYWRQLGALSLLDCSRDALAAYTRAADLVPQDPEAQMLTGVLHMRTGNLGAAEIAFRRQIELGTGNGAGCVHYRGRAMLGDVLALREDFDAALAAYTEAQGQVKTLLEREPDNAGFQRDLSTTYDRIGDMHARERRLDAALESYRQSLSIAEELARRDPENLVWQHDLSVSHDRFGEILDKTGDREEALASYRKGLAIAQSLAQREPGNPQRQWELSVSCERVGDCLIALGKLSEALENYRQGMAITEALVRRDPMHAGWQRDLAASCHRIGSLEALENPIAARELLQKGRAIIARLDAIAAHQAQWRSDLSRFDDALRTLNG